MNEKFRDIAIWRADCRVQGRFVVITVIINSQIRGRIIRFRKNI